MTARWRRWLNWPTGWWVGPGMARHHCTPPGMPSGVPRGVIYRCECGTEWTWKPAKKALRRRTRYAGAT